MAQDGKSKRLDPASLEPSRPRSISKIGQTGLPATLQEGVESLSGFSLDDVRVHYNSSRPAKLQAHAYAQGTDIYVAPGQQKHLPHEAWHIVQQKQRRVKPTRHVDGVPVSDRLELEHEADRFGALALRGRPAAGTAGPTPSLSPSTIAQRRVKISFSGPTHEMEDFDEREAVINFVQAERTTTPVATENKFPNVAQHAHTTAHAVMTYSLVRNLDGLTWAQAWEMIKGKFKFLLKLHSLWSQDETLKDGQNAALLKQLPGVIQSQVDLCERQLSRGGHPINKPLWGARPMTGSVDDWIYYDHLPTQADAVDPATHIVKEWKPRLQSADIATLQDACEQWMLLRGQIPWTSVDSLSFVTDDRVGPDKVEAKAKEYATTASLTADQAGQVAKAIITSFDFFPESFTKTRKLEHGAAVAARHVIEHFKYHPSIQKTWHKAIKSEFLTVWKDRLKEIKASASRLPPGKQKGKRALDAVHDTSTLDTMLNNWDSVSKEFKRVYDVLYPALS